MRIAEYKQIDTEYRETQIPTFDDFGNQTGYQTISEPHPIMGMVYRDATPEEEAEALAMDDPVPEPTIEEKVSDLEDKVNNDKVTDEVGNVYQQYINSDGTVKLRLVESYKGELFE